MYTVWEIVSYERDRKTEKDKEKGEEENKTEKSGSHSDR